MLQNKVVWITGASSGIGEAISYAFAEKGCQLILSGRNAVKLEDVKRKCQKPDKVEIVLMDISKHNELTQTTQKVIAQFGHIDILVNNAGISQRSMAIETSFEVDQKIINTNLLGTIAFTKAVLPSMVKRKQGQIIVISSLMGKFAAPLRSGYAASKHGLHGFFDALRMELDDYNIKVLMVCPGFVKTNISINAITADGSKQGTMDDATNKGILPNEVAKKILSALNRNKEEIYIGKREVTGVYLKRFFPKLLTKVLKKAKVT